MGLRMVDPNSVYLYIMNCSLWRTFSNPVWFCIVHFASRTPLGTFMAPTRKNSKKARKKERKKAIKKEGKKERNKDRQIER